MKIYHTETQEDYDALMIELEIKGYKWISGHEPTSFNYWEQNKESSCIKISGKDIAFRDIEQCKKQCPYTTIVEYKAKGENMLNTECKQCHKKWHHDNAKYCSMCGKRLDEQPEFKVGDYVTDTSDDDPFICKIERIEGIDISGRWYCVSKNYFDRLIELPIPSSRLSTPEEVKLYESALNFYNHGREPFEVKNGDLVRTPSENITFIFNPKNYTKEEFLDYGWKFLKTAEEIDEWLGVADDK